MDLELILIWSDSGGNNCPSIYKAENGDYVIQGWQLDADTSAKLHNLAHDETAVRIPASLITDLAAAIGH